jgi:hypothetical protein
MRLRVCEMSLSPFKDVVIALENVIGLRTLQRRKVVCVLMTLS